MSKATSDILDFLFSWEFAGFFATLCGVCLIGLAAVLYFTGRKDSREEREDFFRD